MPTNRMIEIRSKLLILIETIFFFITKKNKREKYEIWTKLIRDLLDFNIC